MSHPRLAGIHHVKIPVTDLHRSLAWYTEVFGYRATIEFPEGDGTVRGVGGLMPGLGDTVVAFRENPQAAQGCDGFDPVSFAVADRADVESWAAHLDALGIPHSPVIEASSAGCWCSTTRTASSCTSTAGSSTATTSRDGPVTAGP